VGEACCANIAGVTVFGINATTGKLTVVKGSPFLPPPGDSEPSSVTVDPTGRYGLCGEWPIIWHRWRDRLQHQRQQRQADASAPKFLAERRLGGSPPT
jgi:hypothetical protein